MPLTRRHTLTGLAAASTLIATGARADTPPPALTGSFLGTLKAGKVQLRLRMVITPEGQVTLYSFDQGNAPIPCSGARFTATTITLEFAAIGARYEGKLDDTGGIRGTFTQGAPLPLDFVRGEAFAATAADGPMTQASLHAQRLAFGTPGMAAGWNRKGKTTVLLADGIRSAESDAAVTVDDRWHIGSMSKSITATLAGVCVDAGKITWQTTVGDILGDKVASMNAAYKPVSLLHLLSHRGGLQPNPPMTELMTFSRGPLADPRPERLKYAALVLGETPAAAMGEKMIYSNSGFVVAGAMLEAVMGQSWEDLVTARVFAPLGLKGAGFGPPEGNQPAGHSIAANGTRSPTHLDNPVALSPAGRVHMTAGDLIAYLSAHRDCPEKLLKADTWKTLHTAPFGGEYALGWVAGPDGTLWHNGSNTAWYAEGLIDPQSGVVAATLANDAAGMSGGPGKALMAARQAALA